MPSPELALLPLPVPAGEVSVGDLDPLELEVGCGVATVPV